MRFRNGVASTFVPVVHEDLALLLDDEDAARAVAGVDQTERKRQAGREVRQGDVGGRLRDR